MPRRSSGKPATVTIRTVAERAGVSAMTVSNVLNNRSVVTESTRKAVLKAIADLNYRPNVIARQLSRASTVTVGIPYSDVEHGMFSAFLVGALNASSTLDAQLLIQQIDYRDLAKIGRAISLLKDRGANALLLPPVIAEAVDRSDDRDDVPALAVAPGSALQNIPSFRIDERSGARDVVRHLIAKGHRRIGFVAPTTELELSKSRQDGFVDALQEHGISVDPDLFITAGLRLEDTVMAAEALLAKSSRPSAIFAWNDDLAAAVLIGAHRQGLHVPQDLAVAGFDDSPLATKVWPALTTVRHPIQEMARLAFKAIVEAVRSGTSPMLSDEVLPHELVVRASTEQ